jgi:hypothetical protein
MNEKSHIKLTLLYTLSEEISSEEQDGKIYTCRKIKRKGSDKSYEIKKKRSAMSLILAKTDRNSFSD